MDLGNPVETILLIRGMTCLGPCDEFPMSALIYMMYTGQNLQ